MQLLIALVSVLVTLTLAAQSPVTGGEYFFDEDPGFGQGVAFDYPGSGETVTLSIPVPAAIGPGLHRYYVRVRDARGVWSQTYSQLFSVQGRYAPSGLAALEWFWDEDPGYGAGTRVDLSDSTAISLAVDASALDPGLHKFYVRALGQDGVWGITAWQSTLLRAEPDAPISRLEYSFLQGDTVAAFTYALDEPQHYVDVSFEPETTGLVDGERYAFCVAAVRTDGEKSNGTCQNFTYSQTSTSVQDLRSQSLILYPNPNRGSFTVELPEAEGRNVFELFNATGQSVHRQILEGGPPRKVDVTVSSITSGVYFAVMERHGKVHVQRMVVN